MLLLLLLQVSVMTKLVPSPDWFIGLDSIDLCREGQFTQHLTVEVRIILKLDWSLLHFSIVKVYLTLKGLGIYPESQITQILILILIFILIINLVLILILILI